MSVFDLMLTGQSNSNQLNKSICSEHFTNDELQILYNEFNKYNFITPENLVKILEQVYEYKDFDDFMKTKFFKQMYQDGLGGFWKKVVLMKFND